MDMHIVAFGRGFPSPERLSQIQYNTENPLRRAGGFAGVVVVQPEAISRFVIPDQNLALCDARTEPVDTIEPGA
ncbi:sphingosine N-acyltransferase lac1 [Puccinia graminis f. sp. tritici]|uniref:Sphingosine N-acyltransferase lac1 n=1 Tax=Puccinia graminis f. sp. tritici TaxID=56615 RepID=A0A5B0Q8U9_PUCGR|nr:sphingosine N-acyltransferase lac1 [Puccinia graminis f. sp. tritici]